MRTAFVAAFVLAAGFAYGATPKSAITVNVEWANYDELHCEGCRTQTVTMDAGSDFITTHKRDGKMIYTKIAGDWVGEAIRVTLTDEARSENGAFVDLMGNSALLEKGETKEIKVGDIRFLVSAAKTTDKSTSSEKSVSLPNQSSEPTLASGTSPAGQEPRLP